MFWTGGRDGGRHQIRDGAGRDTVHVARVLAASLAAARAGRGEKLPVAAE